MSIELPRFAVLASVHRTATVSSFDPRKKVRIELQTVAVLWTLFKTAIYGSCAQVCWWGWSTPLLEGGGIFPILDSPTVAAISEVPVY